MKSILSILIFFVVTSAQAQYVGTQTSVVRRDLPNQINISDAIVDTFGLATGVGEIVAGVLIAKGSLLTGPGALAGVPTGYVLIVKGAGDTALNARKLYLTMLGKDGRPTTFSAIGYLAGKTVSLGTDSNRIIQTAEAAGDFTDYVLLGWVIPKVGGVLRTIIDMKALHSVVNPVTKFSTGIVEKGKEIRGEIPTESLRPTLP
jgi:hypothetical protein